MSINKVKSDLLAAIQQAEHKPGDWSQTAQSMGGICCPGEKFQVGKPWPQEQPWARFNYKRDSWLAVAAVNALPALLAEIDRLELIGRISCNFDGYMAVLAERAQLKTENDALRKDAERYRGVRRVANRQGFTNEQFDQKTDTRVANFDKAIDQEKCNG